ncbi:hypothetical protein [Bacillus sp. HSf4]|uniref:HAAS domain-containing protein n=1 Tax=Bacillus sp. HSf4 TaxID=3035514 RepID=UPI0024099621|nr:hypothetical protein [Bacillus sp. HSf4]WFA06627.1 hypothetical protein P3X63_07610 [Bacillus sp. HSf4]
MRLYLVSKRKSDREIKGIMDELTVHAAEGEKEGKSVRQIFGDSPKAYAQEVAKELSTKPRENARLVFFILLGAISLFIFNDAVNSSLNYSPYALIGYPLYILLGIIMTPVLGRISAFKGKKRTAVYISIYSIFMFSSILAIILLDRFWGAPVLTIDGSGRWLVMAVAFIVIALLSFWMKVKFLAALPPLIAGVHVLFQWLEWNSPGAMLAEAYIPYLGLILLSVFEAKGFKKTAP